jgi:oxalate decarboxylase/phosphoglucose isomerase-like protein (cupin superfamily)
MIRGGDQKKNITVWEPGVVGNEYIKAYGHYHILDFIERYEVLAGEGIVITQTREIDPATGKPIDEKISAFEARYVKAGDIVDIPERAGHLMVNVGNSWLVTRDDSPVRADDADPVSHPSHADYAPFKKMHGAAYYVVVGEDGKPTLKKNEKYEVVPEAEII